MRTGLFLSRDDGSISKTVDLEALVGEYSHLPVVKVYDSFFRFGDQQDLLRTVREEALDGIVLAGDSPQYFDGALGGTLILEALESQGINQNKVAFANLREQVALPYEGQRDQATKKAQLLIDVALAKVEISPDIKSVTVAPRRSVLVIGTTVGAIVAANELLARGYRVYLVEAQPSLRLQAELARDVLPILTAVQSSERADFLFSTDVKDVSGYCGQYRVVLEGPEGDREVPVGGILLSVGKDAAWIGWLRSRLRFITDAEGFIEKETEFDGQTSDPGVWFIPSREEGDLLAAEISGAGNAVVQLTALLDRNEIVHPLLISEVDEKVCGGCGTCVKTCAFGASSIDMARKLSVINPERCRGCGNCVTACPTGARDLVSYPRKYVTKAINLLSRGVEGSTDPKILAILCRNCGYAAADAAGARSVQELGQTLSINVMPLMVECGGNVDTQYLLEAFNDGFNGVALFVCADGHCRNVVGNTDMQRRVNLFRAVLRSRNIDDERLRVIPVTRHEGKAVIDEIRCLSEDLKNMAVYA